MILNVEDRARDDDEEHPRPNAAGISRVCCDQRNDEQGAEIQKAAHVEHTIMRCARLNRNEAMNAAIQPC